MKKHLFLPVMILLCAVMPKIHAQSDPTASERLQQFVRNIQVFNRLVPQEKVYLHFDNTSYVLGDTIWFKAYVVNASDFQPDTLSGVLYVELLNEKGKILETKKLKIEDGQCHGEFALDDTNVEYFAGFYEVRSYTKFMLNFGEETVFSRIFPVFNNFKTNGKYTLQDVEADLYINDVQEIPLPNLRSEGKKRNKVNLDFYPEGGNLIIGMTSRVAFRITNEKGQALNVAGNILNSQGEVLTAFSTQYAGMGYFSYTSDGKVNQAKINYDSKDYSFDLPTSKPEGYVMHTYHAPQNAIIVQIEKSPQIPISLLGLSILCRGEVIFFQEVEFEKDSYILKIPYEELGTGVHQITLFDSKGEIFAERLAFLLPGKEKQIRLEAVTNKENYEPEDLIQIDFSLTGNQTDKTAVFSLAVRDEGTMIYTHPGNIYTDLLLSSDLKGFIENPEDYFSTDNSNLQIRKLDLLMMVQGWKRYVWQTMAGVNPFKSSFNLEKQLTIRGNIATKDGKNIELLAGMTNNSGDQRMDGEAQTDDKGEFYFFPADFYGTWSLSLRSQGLSDANKKIRLDRWFSPAPRSYAYSETSWINNDGSKQKSEEDNPILERVLSDSDSIAYNIQTVDISTKQKKRKTKEFTHHVGMAIDRAIDFGEKIPNSVHDYLREQDELYSFGSTGEKDQPDTFSDPFSEDRNSDSFGRDIFVQNHFYYLRPFRAYFLHLYEGNFSTLARKSYRIGERAYDVREKELTYKRIIQDVEKIVISGERVFLTDDLKLYTPIHIYPYKDHMMRNMPGTRYTSFEGYSAPADYFKDRIVDGIYRPAKIYHRTLYWNPNVKTDEQGKVSIRFYNNDFCEKINISAEGITANGIPIVAQ
ncbi:hypothetical protein LJC52_01105 [Bacteroidales bacterium OttesenSCG-928-A17]|nr:hypothetical protein [Bacteroidales bacterium OttesenSCG-928-A17]